MRIHFFFFKGIKLSVLLQGSEVLLRVFRVQVGNMGFKNESSFKDLQYVSTDKKQMNL